MRIIAFVGSPVEDNEKDVSRDQSGTRKSGLSLIPWAGNQVFHPSEEQEGQACAKDRALASPLFPVGLFRGSGGSKRSLCRVLHPLACHCHLNRFGLFA